MISVMNCFSVIKKAIGLMAISGALFLQSCGGGGYAGGGGDLMGVE